MSGLPPFGSITQFANFKFDEISLDVGDIVSVSFYWVELGVSNNPSNYEISIVEDMTFSSIPSPIYAYGQSVSLNSSLPNETKQTDFLSWLIKLFNLYIVPDKIDPKKLIIEPRDEFYTNEIVDLTNYLDTSKDLVIKPMGVLDFRELDMSYKNDTDEYNQRYTNVYREAYSTKKVKV
jgi:hypothetical protein